MSITEAMKAAELRLQELAGRPATVWINQSGKGVPRLEVFDGPVANQSVTLRGGTRSEMLLQVDVVASGEGPDHGDGDPTPGMRTYAQAIVDQFPANLRLGNAKVTKMPEVAAFRKDGSEYRCSVTISYRLLS